MLQTSTLIGLFFVMCVYGISVIGVKKYEVITTAMMLGKKELLGFVLGLGVVFLGILMHASRYSMNIEGGLITGSIGALATIFFAENASVTSLAVLLVTMIPAYVFQVFAISKVTARLKISYTKLFFYVAIYATNLALYSNMNFTAGQAVMYFLASAFFYYGVMVFSRVRGKKDYLYLMGFAGLLAVFFIMEKGMPVSMVIATALAVIESIIMAVYVSKSIILRRTLRKVGFVMLLFVFIWVNSI